MAHDYDAIVLGGGAAGLMCALLAGQRGLRVRVLEHANKVGKKILMSGGGRCNFTHLHAGPGNYLSANPHFCKSALARYTPYDFLDLVERHRIPWHEKSPGQLFCDRSSKDIVAMLLTECERANAQVDVRCPASAIEPLGDGFRIDSPAGRFTTARLVVATGGLSIPSLGASGFGYDLARRFGHGVLPTRAGLVPLTLAPECLERLDGLSGVSLPVTASAGGTGFSDALLVTHRGLSGPAILQISSFWAPGEALTLDLLPGVDARAALDEARSAQPAQRLQSWLAQHLPRRLAQRLCEHWLEDRPLQAFRKADLDAVADRLGAWRVQPNGSEGYRTAEVTLGGVDTSEISSTTFESRRVPGLHFIGEVLDVTGWLGGYNFQWAWASAHAAAQALG